jgi:endopolyphosphatase
VNATFDWIAAELKDKVDFVIWTGDSARHDSDEEIPRSSAEVLGSNQWMTSKFVETFSHGNGEQLSIPIIPTFGNNDILPHNILLPGPNKWLKSYASIWRPFIPEAQRHSFEFGGWFFVEAIPDKLAVFSLNTLYFFDRNAGVDDCASPSEPGFKQMEWLHIQLELLRQRGMKAILTGHVPPARTDSKTLWDETCWQKYTLWLRQFRDVVVGSVYGHMNIDHFLLQDTRELNFDLLGASADGPPARVAMEDEMSVESTADYLKELRQGWSRLPNPLPSSSAEDETSERRRKKKHHKDLGGPWAERFQLSLVGPSLVPNYFPTIRLIEYNISGLDDAQVWMDTDAVAAPNRPADLTRRADFDWDELDKYEQTVRHLVAEREKSKKDKHHKTPKKPKSDKKKKKQPPKDPNLVMPEPPAKTSPPGPAYSVQPLTFLGFEQYYANLTVINNDMIQTGEEHRSYWPWGKWRKGKHSDNKPKNPGKPNPRKFVFQIEYSTFNDTIYNMKDLTVPSFVNLAYQMGQVDVSSTSDMDGESMSPVEEETVQGGDFDRKVMSSDEEAQAQVTGHKKKGKKHKKNKKAYKTWLHFLRHAFVSTVEPEELEKL